MNQIFNPTRFFKYVQYNYLINKRGYLYGIAGFCCAMLLILILLLSMSNNWRDHNWVAFYTASLGIFGIIVFGKSFTELRSKESAINYMILPASTFEKFIFELLSKLLIILITYGVLFPFITDLSVIIARFIKPNHTITFFSFAGTFNNPRHITEMFIFLFILVFCVAFAGSTAFRKRPILMTIIFTGLISLSVIGYLYILSEKLELNRGIEYTIRTLLLKNDNYYTVLKIGMACTSIVSLTYAYFKIKEKEV